MKRIVYILLLSIAASHFIIHECLAQVKWIESTPEGVWKERELHLQSLPDSAANIIIDNTRELQVIDGFGVCFNELGWTALSVLDDAARDAIMRKLFDPHDDLKLNICRMPIGANDYAHDYYSLNDSVNDFNMHYFNIERDKNCIIPYIRLALKFQPQLKVWGSPWTPPYWMKTNLHYACKPDVVNDMNENQAGREGLTQFRMEPSFLKAYALYFRKYIEAYRNEGIPISGIHVQNEMNSCQNFPSCIWTASDLGLFIGKYLGPELRQTSEEVEIWYGTYERPFVQNIDTILQDPEISQFITGVSFQWAGKQAIPGVHAKYPSIKLMQSETECGDGSNDWKAAEYTFTLMKHYFDHGISAYTFWNSVLDETGKSMWGWKQNTMITLNSKTKEIGYNPEYYLLKHFSHYIMPGARMLAVDSYHDNVLAFKNPDKRIVIIAANTTDNEKLQKINLNGRYLNVKLKSHSLNTFIVR